MCAVSNQLHTNRQNWPELTANCTIADRFVTIILLLLFFFVVNHMLCQAINVSAKNECNGFWLCCASQFTSGYVRGVCFGYSRICLGDYSFRYRVQYILFGASYLYFFCYYCCRTTFYKRRKFRNAIKIRQMKTKMTFKFRHVKNRQQCAEHIPIEADNFVSDKYDNQFCAVYSCWCVLCNSKIHSHSHTPIGRQGAHRSSAKIVNFLFLRNWNEYANAPNPITINIVCYRYRDGRCCCDVIAKSVFIHMTLTSHFSPSFTFIRNFIVFFFFSCMCFILSTLRL